MKFKKLITYELFVIVGVAMAILALLKIFNISDFSSDWFWFIAGLGLMIQGIIALVKQKTFDKKYKVVLKEEFKNK